MARQSDRTPTDITIPAAPFVTAVLLTLGLAVPACEERAIEEREVAKGIETLPEEQPTAPTTTPSTTASTERPWRVPEGWQEDPEPRQMRLATYIVPDLSGSVEVAITRFPGRVGGELANINRWRGQSGLQPIEETDLESAIQRFDTTGFDGYLARIESTSAVMLAAGVYQESIDQTWFVRCSVPDAASADRLAADVFGLARSIAGLPE